MWRHDHLTLIWSLRTSGRGWGALVLVLLAGCDVSANYRAEISSAVNTFASEWNQDDLDGIYNNADPQFRKTQSLSDWQAWANTIQQHWGPLQSADILSIERIVPSVDLYKVETIMKYQNGNTRGRLSFVLRGGPPRLVGAILANAERERPR